MEHAARDRGLLIVIVGPSGAGKDTLVDAARLHFSGRPDLYFVRRCITRPEEAGGEDHEAVSDADFDRLVTEDAFSIWWEAHGLKYGVPRSACDEIAAGRVAIVNGSRSALPVFKKVFNRIRIIAITATPDVLADRLSARGRESRTEILDRLNRAAPMLDGDPNVITIDNSGRLEDATDTFIATLETILAGR